MWKATTAGNISSLGDALSRQRRSTATHAAHRSRPHRGNLVRLALSGTILAFPVTTVAADDNDSEDTDGDAVELVIVTGSRLKADADSINLVSPQGSDVDDQ